MKVSLLDPGAAQSVDEKMLSLYCKHFILVCARANITGQSRGGRIKYYIVLLFYSGNCIESQKRHFNFQKILLAQDFGF